MNELNTKHIPMKHRNGIQTRGKMNGGECSKKNSVLAIPQKLFELGRIQVIEEEWGLTG